MHASAFLDQQSAGATMEKSVDQFCIGQLQWWIRKQHALSMATMTDWKACLVLSELVSHAVQCLCTLCRGFDRHGPTSIGGWSKLLQIYSSKLLELIHLLVTEVRNFPNVYRLRIIMSVHFVKWHILWPNDCLVKWCVTECRMETIVAPVVKPRWVWKRTASTDQTNLWLLMIKELLDIGNEWLPFFPWFASHKV